MIPRLRNSHLNPTAIAPPTVPIEQVTESVLALSDMAVFVTHGQSISYCSKSIFALLGIRFEKILDGGWPLVFELIYPQDLKLFEKDLLPALRCNLKQIRAQGKELIFNFTLRVCHQRGHVVLVAFENQPIEWHGGNFPNQYITVLKNITPFGNREKMLLTISQREEDKRYNEVFRKECIFKWDPFTLRESEVIRLLAQGLSSKQISTRLNISIDTVQNHRKHVLAKARCSSTSELISFANQIGLI